MNWKDIPIPGLASFAMLSEEMRKSSYERALADKEVSRLADDAARAYDEFVERWEDWQQTIRRLHRERFGCAQPDEARVWGALSRQNDALGELNNAWSAFMAAQSAFLGAMERALEVKR